MKVRAERKQTVIFNVSDAEKEKLVDLAKENDMTISDYCRKILFKKETDRKDV